MRLDQYLVEEGFVESRSKSQQLIKAGHVSVDGSVVKKASIDVEGRRVEVASANLYVSRAAHKLKGFLPLLPFSVEGMEVLDIGSSTGGFTEVALEAGASEVTAVDVGSDQMHPRLRNDPRVRLHEQTDIRNFFPDRRYDLVTSDVSFISLHHILEDVDRLSREWIILLFKPQFEVGREVKRDRRGVVQDPKAVEEALRRFEDVCKGLKWRLVEKAPATLEGKEGNAEYCYCFKKG